MEKKRVRSGWIIAGILAVIFVPPFIKYQALLYRHRALEGQLRDLKAEIATLADEKKKLETDITYVERKAREKIGVVRKGEIVLKK